MGSGIREVFYKGQWFEIEGREKKLKSLSKEKIQELCQNCLTSLQTPNKSFAVRQLGTRSYSPEAPSKKQETTSRGIKVIQGIVDQFSRFFEFITGKKAKAQEVRKRELQLAMKLLSSPDEELLESLFKSSQKSETQTALSSLPLSKILKIWVDTIGGIPATSPETRTSLQRLVTYQESIEALRRFKHPNSRTQARKKLSDTITRDSKALQEGGKLYIPGGIWLPEKGQNLPIIYEISKTGGHYTTRAIDISGELFKTPPSPVQAKPTEKSPREEAEESIAFLLGTKKELEKKPPIYKVPKKFKKTSSKNMLMN